MKWSALYLQSITVALPSLVGAGALCAAMFLVRQIWLSGFELDFLVGAFLVFLSSIFLAVTVGFLWVMFYGGPVYATLQKFGWANWTTAVLSGLPPGLWMLSWP